MTEKKDTKQSINVRQMTALMRQMKTLGVTELTVGDVRIVRGVERTVPVPVDSKPGEIPPVETFDAPTGWDIDPDDPEFKRYLLNPNRN